jgi:sulfoxide reductase heme-binding subunit YedZ
MLRQFAKPTLACALLLPWAWLAYAIYLETQQTGSGLGADPVEGLLHYLGEWGMIVLLCAFSVTPLSRRLSWPWLIRSRRMVGLFAFALVAVHAAVFAVFYAQLKWQILLQEVTERPYITQGMASLVILSLLALTSTRNWQRRLGSTWKRLHRWVYLAVPLALLHLLWLRKDSYEDLVVYTLWATVLGAERLYAWRVQHARAVITSS